MSTHCSGCGSAEMALEFLQVAMLMVGVTMSLHVASTCAMVLVLLPALLPCVSAMIVDPDRCKCALKDADLGCRRVLLQRAMAQVHMPHVFMDLLEMIVPGPLPLTRVARCCLHGILCQPEPCHVDVTGTPCQDFAPNGNRLGIHGPQWPVLLAWVNLMLALHVPVIVHENVPQFLVESLLALVQHQYHVFTFLVDCASLGFQLISRKRRFTIMYHKTRTCVLQSPVQLHAQVTAILSSALSCTAWQISDCFLATTHELALELQPMCIKKGVTLMQAMTDMTQLLSPGEHERLALYLQLWAARFGMPACCCSWAVFNLSDNPAAGYVTWSAASGRIPGLRTHNAKYWVPYLGRWLTNKELLACMGLPVYESLAMAAGVVQVHVQPGPEARHMLGNMMHIASVGSVMSVALASCRLIGP